MALKVRVEVKTRSS